VNPQERERELLNLAMSLRIAAADLSDTALSLDRQAWHHRAAAQRIYTYADKILERFTDLEEPA
jgi:hypothetical protein